MFVENGIVTLAVEGEFEVKLGITSDNLFAPWHVYKTKLFLRDPEEPGEIDTTVSDRYKLFFFLHIEQELVHPAQVSLFYFAAQDKLKRYTYRCKH